MSVELRDLDGVSVARLATGAQGGIVLTLSSPSGFLENAYYPAESFSISNEAVTELYYLLHSYYQKPAPVPQPPLPRLPSTQPEFKL